MVLINILYTIYNGAYLDLDTDHLNWLSNPMSSHGHSMLGTSLRYFYLEVMVRVTLLVIYVGGHGKSDPVGHVGGGSN